jgi:methylmalonyl-CoA/ethylmalonyl-CoA epimerase
VRRNVRSLTGYQRFRGPVTNRAIERGDNMGEKRVGKLPFSNLEHVGVVVRDMDKAVEYLASLGIGPFEPLADPALADKLFRGKPSDWKVKISLAKIGLVTLELIQPVEGKSASQEFLDKKGEGIQHIAFAVDDLDREIAELTKQGIEVVMSGKIPGGKFAYLETDVPGGIIIELIQR